jgi:hypothetical protein
MHIQYFFEFLLKIYSTARLYPNDQFFHQFCKVYAYVLALPPGDT